MKSCIAACFLFNFAFVPCGAALADAINDQQDTDEEGLPYVQIEAAKDFSSLATEARQSEKIIMLEVTASYCGYCGTLEEEIIKPMMRSGDYEKNVLIRQLEMDSPYMIKDFTGNEMTTAALAQEYKIKITPTLLFLDADGNEAAERIMGVYSLDFFGAFVDAAIVKGLIAIRNN